MTDLDTVSPSQRRRLALLLLAPSAVLLAAGVVVLLASRGATWKVVGAIVLVIATLLLAVALGLQRSATATDAKLAADRYETELDAAIRAAGGGDACADGCGECAIGDCAVKALPRS